MKESNRKRRILIISLLCVLALTVIIAGLPLWFPWFLRPILSAYGFGYSSYQREGYSHIVLRDVRYSRAGNVFVAKRVEMLVPTVWLWNSFVRSPKNRENVLSATDWRFERTQSLDHSPSVSIFNIVDRTQSSLQKIHLWLPKAVLHNGAVVLSGREYPVSSVHWQQGTLDARFSITPAAQQATVHAQLARLPWHLTFSAKPLQIAGSFTLASQTNHTAVSLSIDGTLSWQSNLTHVSALFLPGSKLPARASLEADNFLVSGRSVRLAAYETLSGSLNIEWLNGIYDINLDAYAEPVVTNRVPPLNALIHATGDTNSIRMETMEVSSPWINAHLSEGFEMAFTGRMLSEQATFEVEADLNRQSLLPLMGVLQGKALLQRESTSFPDIFMKLAGENVRGFGVAANRLSLDARLIWPALEFSSLDIQFANGAKAKAHGRLDLHTRSTTKASCNFNGQIPGLKLPTRYTHDTASASIEFSGPWTKTRHSGQINISGLSSPMLEPLRISAGWEGEHLRVNRFNAAISAPAQAKLTFVGSADIAQRHMDITTMDYDHPNLRLSLEKPVAITFRGHDTNSASQWSLDLSPFHWHGPAGELSAEGTIRWPSRGHFVAAARGLSPVAFQPFFKKQLPATHIDHLSTSGNWTNQPVRFVLDAAARLLLKPKPEISIPISAQVQASGGADGLSISTLEVQSRNVPILSGSGTLPITLEPAPGNNLVQVHSRQPMKLQAAAHPQGGFWNQITEGTRFKFDEASLKLALTGTMEEPEGGAELAIRHTSINVATNRPNLNVDNITARLGFTGRQIELLKLVFLVEGQPVKAQGRIPIPAQWGPDWKTALDWRKGSAELEATSIPIASFVQFAPDYISPQGTLALYLTLLPKGTFKGLLILHKAASRPLPQTGPIQELEAQIRMDGRKIVVERCSALLGGEPLALYGEIDTSRREPATKLPYFNLTLRSDDVPLARQPELILRAQMDLTASNLKGGPPLVSGTARLGKSYYLSDLKLLVPSRLAKPRNRPPYFSVETPLLSDWRLDVSIRGDHFLTVRSPFFSGNATADFRLTGTLKEPIVLGTLKIDNGVVQFPFANLQVKQGEVALRSDNPYVPHLFIPASSQAYNYDVRLNIVGPADKPRFEFSSTPGLSSEQILLMLTTGELPLTETAFTTQQRAGHLALFVSKNILSRLGLGFGTEDRLTIRSGESVTEPGLQSYSFEYKLSDRWAVIGEYAPSGGANINLRWRFYSR